MPAVIQQRLAMYQKGAGGFRTTEKAPDAPAKSRLQISYPGQGSAIGGHAQTGETLVRNGGVGNAPGQVAHDVPRNVDDGSVSAQKYQLN